MKAEPVLVLQASSMMVSAGKASDAVMPGAKTPNKTEGEGHAVWELDEHHGASSGRLQVDVGDSTWMSPGSRPSR